MAEANGLYYKLYGPEGAPPLILSSGLGGSANYWMPNLPALAECHRVLIYDHRGTGRSDRALPTTITVNDFADDMLILMDAVGWQSTSIIGHAAGGVAGLTLALKAPERLNRLIVVNGWSKPDPHFLRCFEARLNLLRNSGVEAFLRAQPIFLYPADWISAHDAELNAELEHQLASFPGIETMEKRIAGLAAFNIEQRLTDLPPGIAALAAKDDMLVPHRSSHAFTATMTMNWGGHACNVTDPETFNILVLAYLGA